MRVVRLYDASRRGGLPAVRVPTLLALNALVFAGRLLQLTAAYAGVERARLARQQAHAADHPSSSTTAPP